MTGAGREDGQCLHTHDCAGHFQRLAYRRHTRLRELPALRPGPGHTNRPLQPRAFAATPFTCHMRHGKGSWETNHAAIGKLPETGEGTRGVGLLQGGEGKEPLGLGTSPKARDPRSQKPCPRLETFGSL